MPRSISISLPLCATVFLAACQPMSVRDQNTNASTQTAAAANTMVAPQPQPRQQLRSVPRVEFLLAQDQAARNLTKIPLSRARSIYVLPEAALTRSDLSKVETITNNKGQSFVVFTFTRDGARRLADISRRNVGRYFALVINGTLEAVPKISAPMTDGILGIQFVNHQTAVSVANAVLGRR